MRSVNIIFYVLFFYSSLYSDESVEYLTFVDEIVNKFTIEMKDEYNMYCVGDGGCLAKNVENIDIMFEARYRATIDDARKIAVKGVQKLIGLINSHEKIRPFLNRYPFTEQDVSLSISFCDSTEWWYTDESVAHMLAAIGKIFYKKAEWTTETYWPKIDLTKNPPVYEPAKPETIIKLFPLLEESFEDAAKLTDKNNCPLKFKDIENEI